MAAPALTLYRLEENLAALMDTVDLVPEEQEQAFAAEFQIALRNTEEKRDAVGQFLAHVDSQIELADHEIDRLRARKQAMERVVERVETYIRQTIESLGVDDRGKYKRLEGRLVTFFLRACPESVTITDEAAVPTEYKTLTLRMPAGIWWRIVDSVDLEAFGDDDIPLAKVMDTTIDKRRVKDALNAKVDVPGAALASGRHTLCRK